MPINENFVDLFSNDLHNPNPRLIYAKGELQSISTSETTVFSVVIPGTNFDTGHLVFAVTIYVTDGNGRTLTPRLKTGGTTSSESITLADSKNYRLLYSGSVIKAATDSQIQQFSRHTINETDATTAFNPGDRDTASEDDANPITIEFTLQLSAAIGSGGFAGVSVYWVTDVDLW